MTLDPGSIGTQPAESGEVVAAVDEIDGRTHLVIADIARDDAWMSIRETEAIPLAEWE